MRAAASDVKIVTDIFERLKTEGERNAFIQSVLKILPREQVRELVSVARFRFDIIGHLPIEILCLVFEKLPIYQAFQLRRVSRTWLERLSATDVVESILQPWSAMGDVELRMPEDVSKEKALAIKAEHIDAYRTGNPFSMARGRYNIVWEHGQGDHRPWNVDYSHGRLAWIDAAHTQLYVRNLEAGQETLYTPPNREQMMMVRLSSNLVAATTDYGRCYVWDFVTDAPHLVRIPSAWVLSMAFCRNTLALLSDSDIHEITTWCLDGHQTRSFQIGQQGRSPAVKNRMYKMTAQEDTVLLLEFDLGPPDDILFTRYTLEGTVIAMGSSGLLHRSFRTGYVSSIVVPPSDSAYLEFSRQLDRIKIVDEEDPRFKLLGQKVLGRTRGILRIGYNLRNDRLETLTIPCKSLELGDRRGGRFGNSWYFWKDAAFHFSHDDNYLPLSAAFDLHTGSKTDIDMHEGQCGAWDAVGSCPCLHKQPWGRRSGFPMEGIRVFGDEIYMVYLSSTGFTAYCFDRNITMAGEQGEFRQQREAARSERIRRRDQTSEAVESEASTEPSIEELEAELVQHENQFWARPHDDLGQHANDTDHDSGDDEEEEEEDGAGTSG